MHNCSINHLVLKQHNSLVALTTQLYRALTDIKQVLPEVHTTSCMDWNEDGNVEYPVSRVCTDQPWSTGMPHPHSSVSRSSASAAAAWFALSRANACSRLQAHGNIQSGCYASLPSTTQLLTMRRRSISG